MAASARKLPADIEEALAAFANAAFACGEWDRNESDEAYESVSDKEERAERKLRRAIARHLKPDAPNTLQKFEAGQRVIWHRTEGAGNSYRPNDKTPEPAVISRDDGGAFVWLTPTENWRGSNDNAAVRVMRRNVTPAS